MMHFDREKDVSFKTRPGSWPNRFINVINMGVHGTRYSDII
jgi:hypothetical protein